MATPLKPWETKAGVPSTPRVSSTQQQQSTGLRSTTVTAPSSTSGGAPPSVPPRATGTGKKASASCVCVQCNVVHGMICANSSLECENSTVLILALVG